MNRLFSIIVSVFVFVASVSLGDAQVWQRRYQNQQFSSQQQIGQNLPPEGKRVRLEDGTIAIIKPFTAEQNKQIRERKARRIELAKTRLAEIEAQADNPSIYPRLPGEFEKQKAVLLSASDWQSHHFSVLKQIVQKTEGHAELVILFNDRNRYDERSQLGEILKVIRQSDSGFDHLRFLNLNLNTIWVRDFGPRLAETENGGQVSIDFYYDALRDKDDDFPKAWSKVVSAEYNYVPWSLQGGNLLANGKGMAIATSRLFEDNRLPQSNQALEKDEAYVKKQIMKFCNIKELVILKPLENESTRHLDMFMTLLAPDLALVAQVDRRYDPQNAQILDQNADMLSRVMVDGKPMRVERIQVPPRTGKYWSPYTNIILTDKLVLMPVFDSDHPTYVSRALETYRRLLPNHHVDTVDMSSMSRLEGSLHCLSCNVPDFATLPEGLLSFDEAVKQSKTPISKREKVNSRSGQPREPIKSAKRTNDAQLQKTKKAVHTYRKRWQLDDGTIHEGYVFGVSDNGVSMLLATQKEMVTFSVNRLSRDDRNWVLKNQDQINQFGKQVRQFVIDYDLK